MKPRPSNGFAIVIVITLLGLLVLATYALSVLGRVNLQLSASKAYQVQARQNALLGLGVALGELQRHAGPDDRITGMAGISGVPARDTLRQWSGVWGSAPSPVWLASGGSGLMQPSLPGARVLLVAAESVANPVNKTDQEFVEAGLVEVPDMAATGEMRVQGRLAYWVGDHGVKLSAYVGTEEPQALNALAGLVANSPELDKVLSYEQLTQAPRLPGITPPALAGQLRMAFHSLGLTHNGLTGENLIPGMLNINSTSVRYWNAVAETYNRRRPDGAPLLVAAAFSAELANRIAESDPTRGKAQNEPFAGVDAFLQGQALEAALAASGGSLLDFITVMEPWLTVRSDTFRIRAYGDAVNPVDAARVEVVAYCEAIVQRTAEELPGFGRRFVITYFRWLGPDDI